MVYEWRSMNRLDVNLSASRIDKQLAVQGSPSCNRVSQVVRLVFNWTASSVVWLAN